MVAAGCRLPWTQKDIKIKEQTIECRINAEDYLHNFMSCQGKIKVYLPPQEKGIRIACVKTTIPLRFKLLSNPDFVAGKVGTTYLEKHLDEILH